MPTYTVTMYRMVAYHDTFEVEAADKQEAEDLAYDLALDSIGWEPSDTWSTKPEVTDIELCESSGE